MKIISFKKKEMKLLTEEQQESYKNATFCYSCLGKFGNKYLKNEKYFKARGHCYYTEEYKGATHNHMQMPIVFHNGSNYDYYFIIKVLAEEFTKQITRLKENCEKYI